MLISNGKGKFSDKTGKYLKRWKMNVSAPYDFTYADINKDGLTDIFYTGGSSDVDPKRSGIMECLTVSSPHR